MAKVLLVEDSPTQAVEIRMLLEEGAHQVMHVANGRLALDVLEREPIELVVTDLEMPEMNGLELVEAMRLDFEHIPAVLVTARGSEELASKALQRGAAGYVPKNHLQTLLNDTIVDVLGVIRSDASFAKLIKTLQKNVFVFDLPNDCEPDLALDRVADAGDRGDGADQRHRIDSHGGRHGTRLGQRDVPREPLARSVRYPCPSGDRV